MLSRSRKADAETTTLLHHKLEPEKLGTHGGQVSGCGWNGWHRQTTEAV